mgnify:CR=1 FL=1
MKEIIVYESYGKRFDKKEDAIAYEKLNKEIDELMSLMFSRTKDVEDGLDYVKHSADTVKACFKIFCDICKNTIPLYKRVFEEVGNGVRHMSHVCHVLSDYNDDYPCLYITFLGGKMKRTEYIVRFYEVQGKTKIIFEFQHELFGFPPMTSV